MRDNFEKRVFNPKNTQSPSGIDNLDLQKKVVLENEVGGWCARLESEQEWDKNLKLEYIMWLGQNPKHSIDIFRQPILKMESRKQLLQFHKRLFHV